MEGMLYLDNSKKIRTDNFDFLKLEKNTILQGKWSKKFLGIKGIKIVLKWFRKVPRTL